ncbi:hypothetical protein BDR04DRAFT_935725, partial [Suillus decipiens]
RDEDRKLIIQWSASHIGIPGNKAADEQAKCAARGDISEHTKLPPSLRDKNGNPTVLPHSKAATKQAFREIIKCQVTEMIRLSPRQERFKEIDPLFPSKRFANLAANLPRRH